MEYRLLGRSGLKISTITMGTMTIGGGKFAEVGNVGVEDARRHVDLCLDAGVNLIDTADIYSTGVCEEIGEVLGGKRKNGVLIATNLHGPGPERRRPLAPAPDQRLRGEPQAAEDRRDRPLPGA